MSPARAETERIPVRAIAIVKRFIDVLLFEVWYAKLLAL
jgi:hypothetical protein